MLYARKFSRRNRVGKLNIYFRNNKYPDWTRISAGREKARKRKEKELKDATAAVSN